MGSEGGLAYWPSEWSSGLPFCPMRICSTWPRKTLCEPCERLFTTRQSKDTSESISTGEPVARRVQLRLLKRASPLCPPLNVGESSQSSARSTLTQNTLLFATAPCVVASLLT